MASIVAIVSARLCSSKFFSDRFEMATALVSVWGRWLGHMSPSEPDSRGWLDCSCLDKYSIVSRLDMSVWTRATNLGVAPDLGCLAFKRSWRS